MSYLKSCPVCGKPIEYQEKTLMFGLDTLHERCAPPPKCPTCQKEVFHHDALTRSNKTFHAKCWVCSVCSSPLKGIFCEENNAFFCSLCFKGLLETLEKSGKTDTDEYKRMKKGLVGAEKIQQQLKDALRVPFRSTNPNSPFYDPSQPVPEDKVSPEVDSIYESDPLYSSVDQFFKRIGLPELRFLFEGMTVLNLIGLAPEELNRYNVPSEQRPILDQEIKKILDKHPELLPNVLVSPRGVVPYPTSKSITTASGVKIAPLKHAASVIVKHEPPLTPNSQNSLTSPTSPTSPTKALTSPTRAGRLSRIQSQAFLEEKEKRKHQIEELKKMREMRTKDEKKQTPSIKEQKKEALRVFLELEGLGMHTEALWNEEIDFETLYLCSPSDLRSLGVFSEAEAQIVENITNHIKKQVNENKESIENVLHCAGLLYLLPLFQENGIDFSQLESGALEGLALLSADQQQKITHECKKRKDPQNHHH